MGPYCVTEVIPNHTYKVERSGQVSNQNEARLKPYWMSPDATGQASPLLESTRRPNIRRRPRANRELEVIVQKLKEEAEELTDRPSQPHHEQSWPTHLQFLM